METAAREGFVKEALPGLMFRVGFKDQPDLTILAHLSGKMKIHNIRVLAGDRVLVELSPDGVRGRIVRRL